MPLIGLQACYIKSKKRELVLIIGKKKKKTNYDRSNHNGVVTFRPKISQITKSDRPSLLVAVWTGLKHELAVRHDLLLALTKFDVS